MERVAILFNPAAGGGKSVRQRARIERTFNLNKIPFDLFVSDSESHLRQLTLEHCNTYRALVLVGGDTTFNIVVSELLNQEGSYSDLPTMGMVGTGSANDIVRSLGVEHVHGLCRAIKENQVRRMDVGVLKRIPEKQNHYFLGTLSAGFGTTVNRYIENFSKKHPLILRLSPMRQMGLAVAGVRQAFRSKQVPCKICCEYDQTKKEIEFSLLVFLNIPHYANGLYLGRNISPFDGFLDCYPLLTRSFAGTIRRWHLISRGIFDRTQFIRSKEFKISSEDPLDWQVDGEIIPGLTEFEVSIHPNPIQVFTGKN